ncbi:MAG TPA: response regulator transcription factor [Dehalococcoidia bacterium]|nr:response regulator transcription factor [Dehalococcoidia bacterium]
MQTILIVDDEPNIIELARLYLERDGYQVEAVTSGQDALLKREALSPDLIVLDLMLPDIDGLDVCRQIRANSTVPILMLTARREDVDKIVGLELGADDYLTKPFNPRELVARVRAVLRRYHTGVAPDEIVEMGNLRLDLLRHEVKVAGKPVLLRTKEFDLLAAFARNLGIVLSREKLLEVVWGYDYYGETRTVDVHVNHLRNKIAGSGVDIETLRGTGYKMTLAGGSE